MPRSYTFTCVKGNREPDSTVTVFLTFENSSHFIHGSRTMLLLLLLFLLLLLLLLLSIVLLTKMQKRRFAAPV